MKMPHWRVLICGIFFLGLFSAVSSGVQGAPIYADQPDTPPSRAVYVFACHPLHNARRIFEIYQPLIDLLNRDLKDAEIKLEAALDYADFEKKLYGGRYAFALPNPLQSIEAARHGYRIFGKVSDDAQFRGIFLVPKISSIRDLADIKGKKVSFPSSTALAACIMPQWFLHQHGINVLTDITSVFVGSQESAITNVATGAVDVGVTWPPPWAGYQKKYPELASKLKVIWETPSMVNNGLVVRSDVPRDIEDHVAQVFFTLDRTEEGKKILADMEYSGFEPASGETYKPVEQFLKTFAAEVRDPFLQIK